MKKRAIVFYDGNNWYHNLRHTIKPSKIDLQKLAKFICDHFNLELIEIVYYNSIPDIKNNEKVYYKHQEFLSELRKQKIIVKTRKLKEISKKNIQVEKGIDVMIASDMIYKSLIEKSCDCCILISGDADFIPAMQIIKDAKREVITSSVIKGYSRELMQGKFRFLIIKQEYLNKCLK
ncbi:NYN domain-containing protein [Nanoarchaeota archaeon]